MIPKTDQHLELVAPTETSQIASNRCAPGSRPLLRFLIVYIPLEFFLVLALAAAVLA